MTDDKKNNLPPITEDDLDLDLDLNIDADLLLDFGEDDADLEMEVEFGSNPEIDEDSEDSYSLSLNNTEVDVTSSVESDIEEEQEELAESDFDFLKGMAEDDEEEDDDLGEMFGNEVEEEETVPADYEDATSGSVVDRFKFLLEEEKVKTETEKKQKEEEEELAFREIVSVNRLGLITADEVDPDFDLTELAEIKVEEEDGFNLDSNLPNIPETEASEYIIIRGMLSEAFKEFVLGKYIITDGEFPLAIEVGDDLVIIRYINPEPKVLFYLQNVLRGYELTLFRDGEEEPLNTYSLLDRAKIMI